MPFSLPCSTIHAFNPLPCPFLSLSYFLARATAYGLPWKYIAAPSIMQLNVSTLERGTSGGDASGKKNTDRADGQGVGAVGG